MVKMRRGGSSSCGAAVIVVVVVLPVITCTIIILFLCCSSSSTATQVRSSSSSWLKYPAAPLDCYLLLEQLKDIGRQAQAYFQLVPDIDFRGGKGCGNIEVKDDDEGGGMENSRCCVKEAATKSLEKSKSVVEDSAKAAADTLHNTADILLKKLHPHPLN